MDNMKALEKEIDFQYEYAGGGYYRKKGFPKKVSAPVLHGENVVGEVFLHMLKTVSTERFKELKEKYT